MTNGRIAGPLILTFAYGIALLILARILITRRVAVTRHARTDRAGAGALRTPGSELNAAKSGPPNQPCDSPQ